MLASIENIFSFLFFPSFGYVQDKLGVKKYWIPVFTGMT